MKDYKNGIIVCLAIGFMACMYALTAWSHTSCEETCRYVYIVDANGARTEYRCDR